MSTACNELNQLTHRKLTTLSFINKALEKAKSLHHQKVKPAPAPSQEPPKMPLPDLDEVTGFAETPGEIHYTYTRKVAVDMDSLRRNRLIVAGSDETLGEAYKLLRTHILHGTKREGRNILMVTGPLPNEGKTLTTINLAIAISQKVGQTVLLVDGDLRNPSIHRYLDLPSGPGLVDYLISGVSHCGIPGASGRLGQSGGAPRGQIYQPIHGTPQFSRYGGFGQGIEALLSGPLRAFRFAALALCGSIGLCPPGGRHYFGSGGGQHSPGRDSPRRGDAQRISGSGLCP